MAVNQSLIGMDTAQSQPPVPVEIRRRMEGALEWIRLAHRMAGDGGISKGYDLLRRRWAPSYPETTGYTIPTLLNAAIVLGRTDLRDLALTLADYLQTVTSAAGAVAHWQRQNSQPMVFDTGQVIFGWLAAYKAAQDKRYLSSAMRAGDWLVSVQEHSGAWQNGQYLGVVKVIDTRVAWALLELYQLTQRSTYLQAATRNLEWALQQQDLDGWFRRCAFVAGEDPFTHTLVYTAEGLFESGRLLGEARWIEGARRTADALLARQHPDGRLASTYASGWRPTSRSSCLTGNCQAAHLWLRIHEITGSEAQVIAARKAISFVCRTQRLNTANGNIRGAIAGSQPIYGRYERFKYPNWAAKFFLDALLALREIERGSPSLVYAG